ncbi:MAG: capsid cement protein [Sedimentisphaerales bacterium]
MAINDVKTLLVADGEMVDYQNGATAIAAGDIVIAGKLIGIAPSPIAANALGAIRVTGIFEFPTAEALATIGTPVYLIVATGLVTATSGGANANVFLGKTVAASTNSDTRVKVLLQPCYTLMA